MEFTWAKGELPAFWGLFDPGWWDRMLDATTSGHYSPEALILTVGIFTLAGVCIALGLLVSVHLRRGETAPSTWVVKPAAVRGLMNMALAQRSKLRVSFVRDDPGARSTDAAILAADPARGIELEMTTLVRANQSWVGKLVACDFRLRPDPRKDYHNFYSFVVPVTRIAKAGDDFIHMTVAWPSRLELEQKRAFLRVEPPRGSILGLDMWHETMVRGTRGSFGDPATWGEALLHWDPRDALSGIEVRNLSGGGLRLELASEAIKRHHALFEPGARFLMRLELAVPGDAAPLECFLALRLQNVYGDPANLGRKAYGWRFLSFGAPSDVPPGALTWKTAVSGVPVVDDWVYRRHLEIYRARGEG